jgi:sec-independent protein translocase protein TatB
MFGMGGSEIIVILIVALLFLGPDKLPQAAKSISKGIRDIKKQSRSLQQQIESDEQIGGAIRDLKSALRGEEAPVRPRPIKPRIKKELADGALDATGDAAAEAGLAGTTAALAAGLTDPYNGAADADANGTHEPATTAAPDANGAGHALTLPPTAGEADPVDGAGGDDELAAMIKPAPGSVAKGS